MKKSILLAGVLGLAFSAPLLAENLDKVMKSSEKKVSAAVGSQKKINGLSEKAQALFDEYKSVEKLVEDLKVYNSKKRQEIRDQEKRLNDIEKSIAQVQVMQRQMLPLIERMIDQLEQFVALDLPFHLEEREERIAFLRAGLSRSDLSTAEKFRQLIEAWGIENEYGRKIESYVAKISVSGQEKEVQMLRVGRIALMYQTLDGSETAAWNKAQKQWQVLAAGDFAKATRQAIKMANKQANIDVITVPAPSAEAYK